MCTGLSDAYVAGLFAVLVAVINVLGKVIVAVVEHRLAKMRQVEDSEESEEESYGETDEHDMFYGKIVPASVAMFLAAVLLAENIGGIGDPLQFGLVASASLIGGQLLGQLLAPIPVSSIERRMKQPGY